MFAGTGELQYYGLQSPPGPSTTCRRGGEGTWYVGGGRGGDLVRRGGGGEGIWYVGGVGGGGEGTWYVGGEWRGPST